MIFTFIRILFLLVRFLVTSQGTSLVGSDPNDHSSPPEHPNTLSHRRVGAIPGKTAAHDLASSWCSAYRSFDPERLATLETREVEIVDRFGDWRHLTGLRERERFWREGFDMIRTRDFHPECTIEHVRLIRSDVAIVQARVSYNQGISLKGGDRIPPFSEIHTFVFTKSDDTWLISAQDIVQQTSLR